MRVKFLLVSMVLATLAQPALAFLDDYAGVQADNFDMSISVYKDQKMAIAKDDSKSQQERLAAANQAFILGEAQSLCLYYLGDNAKYNDCFNNALSPEMAVRDIAQLCNNVRDIYKPNCDQDADSAVVAYLELPQLQAETVVQLLDERSHASLANPQNSTPSSAHLK